MAIVRVSAGNSPEVTKNVSMQLGPFRDEDAVRAVKDLSSSFNQYGGVWVAAKTFLTDGSDDGGPQGSVVEWLPAAGCRVHARFDDSEIPSGLADLPGMLQLG